MRQKKAYIFWQDIDGQGKQLAVAKMNFKPADLVCECPKDARGNWITDLNFIEVDLPRKTAQYKKAEHVTWIADQAKLATNSTPTKVSKRAALLTKLQEARSFKELKELMAEVIRNG